MIYKKQQSEHSNSLNIGRTRVWDQKVQIAFSCWSPIKKLQIVPSSVTGNMIRQVFFLYSLDLSFGNLVRSCRISLKLVDREEAFT